jgi:hypothetical protein
VRYDLDTSILSWCFFKRWCYALDALFISIFSYSCVTVMCTADYRLEIAKKRYEEEHTLRLKLERQVSYLSEQLEMENFNNRLKTPSKRVGYDLPPIITSSPSLEAMNTNMGGVLTTSELSRMASLHAMDVSVDIASIASTIYIYSICELYVFVLKYLMIFYVICYLDPMQCYPSLQSVANTPTSTRSVRTPGGLSSA